MGYQVCPAADIAAPVESVWELLVDPVLRDEWWDVRTARVEPEGKAVPGQVISLVPTRGRGLMQASLRVEAVDPEKHQIHWVLTSPGLINHQTTTCTALDASSSWVQYG